MNHIEAGRYWNDNAEAWTRLARSGYDVYRDYLNTPAFFKMLPDVKGLAGLDIGCGEGHNTRLLARHGARMTAVDISEIFIKHASELERSEPLGITYKVASAVELPFPESSFDFAAATMSLMDIPETDLALSEAYRILKPQGFLQFSITHPCYDTPHRKNLRNEQGITYALEIGDYFYSKEDEVLEWIFGATPPELKATLPRFKTPRFSKTLSQWINLLVDTGFRIERAEEPYPEDKTICDCPDMQDAQVLAYFLHFRVRKPKQ